MSRLGGPGFAAGLAAYALWGLFPLYWPLLEPARPLEILAHRIVWSALFAVGVLALGVRFAWLRELGRRRAGLLALAAVLVTVNWGTYIHGVNSGQVVETSLGYFINPLVTVALAVLVLGERLRRAQWAAVLIGLAAVAVLAIDYGHPPWIALTLACSFGLYGLIKNRAGVDGVQSFAVESGLLALPALAYLGWLGATGRGTFTTDGGGHVALLVGAGAATAVPLMLFGVAAVRVRLATIGMLQYLAPILQFLIGVLVDGEHMPLSRLAGFGLVWIALVVLTVDALVRAPRPREQGEHRGAPGQHERDGEVVQDVDHVTQDAPHPQGRSQGALNAP
jgi:chloramphenicol-sensitive protein RarD